MIAITMPNYHDDPNAAFSGTHADENWIELFHSRPSWKVTQISYKKDGGAWVPFGFNKFIDASDMKPGFRVFRTKGRSLEFRVASAHTKIIDSNNGRNYRVSAPGRYVVEGGNGCRWISEAQIADCLRALRPRDHNIELLFEPSGSWRNCIVTFAPANRSQEAWYSVPMLPDWDGRLWHKRLQSKTALTCAFHDDGNIWDSNIDRNYLIPLPGKYLVKGGMVEYLGVSEADACT